jgi:hypothetical protein
LKWLHKFLPPLASISLATAGLSFKFQSTSG